MTVLAVYINRASLFHLVQPLQRSSNLLSILASSASIPLHHSVILAVHLSSLIAMPPRRVTVSVTVKEPKRASFPRRGQIKTKIFGEILEVGQVDGVQDTGTTSGMRSCMEKIYRSDVPLASVGL